MTSPSHPLANAKHEAVALAYLTDPERVGWRAYRKAYPKSSRHAAECGFTRLQKNVEFSARLADLGEQAAQGAVMAAQEALERISARARDETDPSLQLRALELIGKHHKLFTDRIDISGAHGLAERLAAGLARARNADRRDRGTEGS
jgi:hypothetical protein